VIKQVLVTTFGFTKTGFVLILQGSSQNLSTKTFCFGFFLSHEPKLLQKLASPIRDENSQNTAYRYKTYIRRNKKKRKKRKKSFGRLQGSALRYAPEKCGNLMFRNFSFNFATAISKFDTFSCTTSYVHKSRKGDTRDRGAETVGLSLVR